MEIKISFRLLVSSLAQFLIFFISLSAGAKVSPLCTDLARYSCAPGSHKDPTGEVKSSSEVQNFMSSYLKKSRNQINNKFKKILDDPENAYFKELAISSFGLKSSPQCISSAPEDIKACQENLLDGLTTLAQKQIMGPLLSKINLQRGASLSDIDYVLSSYIYQKTIKDLRKQAQSELSDPKLDKKIKEKIFPDIKNLIIKRLETTNISDEQKKFMINKIKSIQFSGSTCEESDGEGINQIFVSNAFYSPEKNTFKLCSGLTIESTSMFDIVMTIGHELAHSIDPCSISYGPSDMGFQYKNSVDLKKMEEEYPLKNVLSCLRDPRSVKATNLNEQYKTTFNGAAQDAGNGSRFRNSENGVQSLLVLPKSNFCTYDEIGESIADWMGAEILPEYIEKNYKLTREEYQEGYANAFRILCSRSKDPYSSGDGIHPATVKRINKIILVNPKIRAQMGCPEKHPENVYCDSEKRLAPQDASTKVFQPAGDTDDARGVK